MSGTQVAPLEVLEPDLGEDVATERPWQVILWDDPVNTFEYVIFVLRKLFGFSKTVAGQLTRQVHEEGKAIVSSGPREKAELDVFRLHEAGLWATMEQPS